MHNSAIVIPMNVVVTNSTVTICQEMADSVINRFL